MSKQVLDDLRQFANTRAYDVQQLSDSTGISSKTIIQVLNGKNDNPTLQTVCLISKCLGGYIVFRTDGNTFAEITGDISYYRRLLAEKQDQLATKDKWIFRLFVTCLCLIASNIIIALCFSTI